jgi:hypothetical protein
LHRRAPRSAHLTHPTREGKAMTILDNHTAATGRSLVGWTLMFCATGFVTGFLLSLVFAAYSLYVCVEVR